MKIHKYDIIKHKNHKDVCFCVFSIEGSFGSNKKYKVEGVYYNLGFVNSYCMNVTDKITIKESQLNDWLICQDKEAKCLRYAKWA